MAIRPRRGAPRGVPGYADRATASAANAPRGSWARVTISTSNSAARHCSIDRGLPRRALRLALRATCRHPGPGVRRGAVTVVLSSRSPVRRSGAVISTATTWLRQTPPVRAIASSFRLCRQPLSMPVCSTSSSAFRCAHTCRSNTRNSGSAELRRLCRPGGLVLLSVQGKSQSAPVPGGAGLVRQLDQFGFVIKGVNPSINDLIGSSSYVSRCGADARPHPRALGSSFRGARVHRQPRSESGSRGDAGGRCRLGWRSPDGAFNAGRLYA